MTQKSQIHWLGEGEGGGQVKTDKFNFDTCQISQNVLNRNEDFKARCKLVLIWNQLQFSRPLIDFWNITEIFKDVESYPFEAQKYEINK